MNAKSKSPPVRRLTGVQFDTLLWMVSFDAAHGRSPTQREVAAHFDVAEGTSAHRCRQLAKRGCITATSGRGGSTAILEEGRARVAAGRDAATMRRVPDLGPAPDSLPALVHVEQKGLDVVRVFYRYQLEGRAPTSQEVADAVARTLRGVKASVATLCKLGLIAPVAHKDRERGCGHLTHLGIAVAEGRVPTARNPRTGRPRKAASPVTGPGVSRVRAAVERTARPAVVKVHALPPPPPAPTGVKAAMPAPVVAAAPPPQKDPPDPRTLGGFRGVHHPAMPSFATAQKASRSLLGFA